MTPTVGRIVHVLADPKTNNGADVAPAIITRVWSESMINVRVLLDGPDAPWWTSISLYADRETADARIAEKREQLVAAGNPADVVIRAGFWPART